MKKLMAFIASAIFTVSVCAQQVNESNIPAAVKSAYKRDYPSSTGMDGQWQKKDGNYRAHYTTVNEDIMVTYDKNGNLIERESKIDYMSLPASVKGYFDRNMPGKTTSEVYKVTDKNGNVVYKATIESTAYRFDSNGTYLDKDGGKN